MFLGAERYAYILLLREKVHGVDHISEKLGHIDRLGAEGKRAFLNAGERAEIVQSALYAVIVAVERADVFAELVVCNVLGDDGYARCGKFYVRHARAQRVKNAVAG